MENNEHLSQLLRSWEIFNSTNDKEEKNSNDQYLKNFIKFENFDILNQALFKSNNNFLEFYGSTGLIQIITNNFITIDTDTKVGLLNSIQSYLVKNLFLLFLRNFK